MVYKHELSFHWTKKNLYPRDYTLKCNEQRTVYAQLQILQRERERVLNIKLSCVVTL